MLHDAGFSARCARSAEEALAMLAKVASCSLVVCEALLPGASGFALLNRIATHHAGVGAVLCVDPADGRLAVQAFRRGAADVLLKPVEFPVLRHAVEGALLQGRMRGERLSYLRSLETLVSERTGKLREIKADL